MLNRPRLTAAIEQLLIERIVVIAVPIETSTEECDALPKADHSPQG
jgi:hypothetical protein